MRQLPSTDYLRLKAAFRDLVALTGGVTRAAGITGQGASHLCEAGAPHSDRFPRADHIADLEAECGQPVVTRTLADMAGFDLVPRHVSAATPRSVHEHIARVIIEFSGVTASTVAALADGLITEAERLQILRETEQAIDHLQAFRAALKPALKAV